MHVFHSADGTLADMMQEKEIESEEMRAAIPHITPGHVLAYATGAAVEPASGFSVRPKIKFVHVEDDNRSPIPSASTCTNTLTMYVNSATQGDQFHAFMVKALMNGTCFSFCWDSPELFSINQFQ